MHIYILEMTSKELLLKSNGSIWSANQGTK